MDNTNKTQNSENNNPGITSFAPEEATPISGDLKSTKQIKSSDNLMNKDIVTRPLLWGLVVFLVFFGLVIGAVSVYRMYQLDNTVEEMSIPAMPCGDGVGCALPPTEDKTIENTPVTADTNTEANIVESEIRSIDSDLEGEVYSDESLGL
jgi:hypothetical protein